MSISMSYINLDTKISVNINTAINVNIVINNIEMPVT